ncbi:MAG: hypothetical protein EA411_11120, partial [Saprospirales bacterium]
MIYKNNQIMYITKLTHTLLLSLFLVIFLGSQGHSQIEQFTPTISADSLEKIFQRDKAEALDLAEKLNLPVRLKMEDGTISELMRFENGRPVYFITHNAGGAELINTNELYSGGSAGLDLSGEGQLLGIWDGGAVRNSHIEFEGRSEQKDGATQISNHATHVAGTMVAAGIDSSARGMSWGADLHSYDWNNDNSEMLQAASQGLQVSQHSYGIAVGWGFGSWSDSSAWHWFGDPGISETEDYKFGFYDSKAQEWDQIAHSQPYYLIVKSAGNDRGMGPPPGTGHFYFDSDSSDWVFSTTVRDIDGGDDGYTSISHTAVSKNNISVGAVNASGNMTGFSGWGPTHDGRIKPDVVAKGSSVYSATGSSDSAYSNMGGTSMSGPMVSGSVGILMEHYDNLHPGERMLAATIKGLIIHTADDMISGNQGPDYEFGWGLMDTEKAAEVISRNADADNALIYETTLDSNEQISLQFESSGDEPLKATIVWTDLPGPIPPASLNPTDTILVNDLDLRIFDADSSFYFPYILDPGNPSDAATTGDNFRDNVEMVFIEEPDSNDVYTVKVDHKGSLTGGQQNFTLVVTGGSLTGLEDYDIAPVEFLHPTSQICGLTFIPEIVLKNLGLEIIEDAYFHYALNNEPFDSTLWTGSVAPLQTISIDLPELTANPGQNTLTVFSSSPNGMTDQNPNNDTIEITFFVNESILYVDHEASGQNNGLDWDNAFESLQDALDVACNCEVVVQIWVAEGNYLPDDGQNVSAGDRNASFQLCRDVELYGGFLSGGSSLSDRDWVENETILDGNIGDPGVAGDNSFTVVNGTGVDSTAILDGFFIQNGFANGGGAVPNPNFRGGGLYVNNGAPTVANCSLRWNAAGFGGAVYLINSQTQFSQVKIDNNFASTAGGGMYALNSNFFFKNGSIFNNNTNNAGGGILNEGGNPEFYNTAFYDNEAVLGAGMYNAGSSPVISRAGFRGNKVEEKGGAIYNANKSTPVIVNTGFTGNFAEYGAGIYNENSSPQVINSTFAANHASQDGSAFYNEDDSSPEIKNSIIWSNAADGDTSTVSAAVFNDSTSSAAFWYSIIQNSGGSGPDWDDDLGVDEGDNLDVNPLFEDGIQATNAPDTSGNFMLTECSEAIDAGDNTLVPASDTLDLGGDQRFFNSTNADSAIVDIGAYEFQSPGVTLQITCIDADAILNSENTAIVLMADLYDVDASCSNWNIAHTGQDTLFFDCQSVGDSLIHVEVSNLSGSQQDNCISTVTVMDTVAPIAECQDITVQLDSDGMASISPSEVDNGSSDNCGSVSLSLDNTTFDCDDIGPNPVVLTVEDGSG